MSAPRVIIRLLTMRDQTPPGEAASQPPAPATVAPGEEPPREELAWKRREGTHDSMNTSNNEQPRLLFSLDGIDFSDDASLEAFAAHVWRTAVSQWRGNTVNATQDTRPGVDPTGQHKATDADGLLTALPGDEIAS